MDRKNESMNRPPIWAARMSQWDMRLRAAKRAWNDEQFWIGAGDKLTAWGAWAVIGMVAVMIFAAWLRLGA